ncbi:hypothetical protein Bbelb_326880 [Branchiostoma belcheri]|nr:hypothetical protein Bbelb_326880 [Branchiostoma belcheri]
MAGSLRGYRRSSPPDSARFPEEESGVGSDTYCENRPPTCITRTTLDWNPQGKRHRGRPRLSWRRGVRKDLEKANVTWQETKKTVKKRKHRRLLELTEALCSRVGEED